MTTYGATFVPWTGIDTGEVPKSAQSQLFGKIPKASLISREQRGK